MLVISNRDVESLLDVRETISALEGAYVDLAQGNAICRPRMDCQLPTGEAENMYQWGSVEGGSTSSGYFAIRAKSDIVREVEYNGNRIQDKFCVSPGTFCGFILLFSVRNGEPLALINDGVLQHMRVGATAAIGARLMANKDSRTLAMFGSGGMARSHLDALLAVMALESVRVFSPTELHRKAYAEEMSERYGIEVVAVDDPAEVCRGATIVYGCTNATGAVVRGEWLEPGAHLSVVSRELDAGAKARINRRLNLGTSPAPINHPEWNTNAAVIYRAQPTSDVWRNHQKAAAGARDHSEEGHSETVYLADVLAGRVQGRTDSSQITAMDNDGLSGVQFFPIAGRVYELARARGMGHEIPTEWLLEDIRN